MYHIQLGMSNFTITCINLTRWKPVQVVSEFIHTNAHVRSRTLATEPRTKLRHHLHTSVRLALISTFYNIVYLWKSANYVNNNMFVSFLRKLLAMKMRHCKFGRISLRF